jgi:hypothetical protein
MKSNQLDFNIQCLSRLISRRFEATDWQHYLASDWERLIQCAKTQGVAPLLYWAFTKAELLKEIPAESQKALRLAYAAVQIENKAITRELHLLAERFEQANLPLVALKGACFALTIYDDLALRPMTDLDVLVPASRLKESVEIAKSLGYQENYPEASPGLRDLLNHEISLTKSDTQAIVLELHHKLIANKLFRFSAPMDWFWEQTEPLPRQAGTSQASLLMLTPTAQLLYSAAHLALQHGSRLASLRWYYDLDLLVRRYTGRIDWGLLILQARRFEWGSAVYAACSEAQSYFETPLPEQVMKELHEQHDRNESLVRHKRVQPRTHIQEEWQNLLALNGYGRLRLIAALVAPAPAYMLQRYGLKRKWQLPFYYLFRWGTIFMDAIQTSLLWIRHG